MPIKLPLNLQFFAEGDEDPKVEDNDTKVDETKVDKVETVKTSDEEDEEVLKLTQEELNAIVQKRLDRDRKKREEAAEEEKLKANGEYKELLDKANARIAEFEATQEKQARDADIVKALKANGLSDGQVEAHFKWVEKSIDAEDDVEEVVKEYVNNFQIETTVDPSAGFGKGKKPEPKDDENIGLEMLERARGYTRVKL